MKSIELLQVLLEETDDESLSLIANFAEDVDLDAIISAMLQWEVSQPTTFIIVILSELVCIIRTLERITYYGW